MSGLQSDEVVVDNDEYVEVDESESAEIEADESESSELATDSEPEHEQNTEEAKFNQEAVNKVINRKHYEAQEAKREAEELKQRLQQYEQQNQQMEPRVPEKPDPFDDDYDAKMGQYEQAIAHRERWRYEQHITQQQQQYAQQQAQQEHQRKLQESASKYMETAKANGITKDEVIAAGQVVESYGLNTDLQLHLLNDSDGALIVKHLAANPAEIANLSQMSPYQAGIYIEQNLRPKARQLKPKSSNAPPPNKRVSSGNVDPELGRFKHIGGAKFE